MDKDSFILYGRQAQALTDLTLEQKGRLLDALFSYANTKIQPEFDDVALTVAFKFLSLQINVDSDRYEEICKKRAEAGRKGMASRWKNNDNKSNQEITNITNVTKITNDNKDNHNDNDNDNESTNVDIKKKIHKRKSEFDNSQGESTVKQETKTIKRFVKPTIEQVQSYIIEKGYHFTGEAFFDYYESKGWVVGKSPMKDWKAACRTWENKRKEEAPTIIPEQEYPAGLDAEKWAQAQSWMKKYIPRIASYIDPEKFLTMKGIAHRKSGVFSEILEEIEKSGFTGDYVCEFKRLAQTSKYYERIWA